MCSRNSRRGGGTREEWTGEEEVRDENRLSRGPRHGVPAGMARTLGFLFSSFKFFSKMGSHFLVLSKEMM